MTHLLLYSDRNGIYGAERINQRLALAFRRAGFEVTTALPPGENPVTEELARAGIRRFELPPTGPSRLFAQLAGARLFLAPSGGISHTPPAEARQRPWLRLRIMFRGTESIITCLLRAYA